MLDGQPPPLLMVPCLPLRLKYPEDISLMVNWGGHPSFCDRQEETYELMKHIMFPHLWVTYHVQMISNLHIWLSKLLKVPNG